ncbi:hypothetical protein BCO26_0875 [Heyndrickxia coagulans 2-6]|nr:hypothetical protein BCO26_0875 [Heyndrickxia coagulans 2-6]
MNGRKTLPYRTAENAKEISLNRVPFQKGMLFQNAKLSYLIEKGV